MGKIVPPFGYKALRPNCWFPNVWLHGWLPHSVAEAHLLLIRQRGGSHRKSHHLRHLLRLIFYVDFTTGRLKPHTQSAVETWQAHQKKSRTTLTGS